MIQVSTKPARGDLNHLGFMQKLVSLGFIGSNHQVTFPWNKITHIKSTVTPSAPVFFDPEVLHVVQPPATQPLQLY